MHITLDQFAIVMMNRKKTGNREEKDAGLPSEIKQRQAKEEDEEEEEEKEYDLMIKANVYGRKDISIANWNCCCFGFDTIAVALHQNVGGKNAKGL